MPAGRASRRKAVPPARSHSHSDDVRSSIRFVATMAPALRIRGRAAEIAVLGESLDRVTAGRLSVVLIEGEAGIGKTRLLDAALQDARGRGMQVAAGRAQELERARPLAVGVDDLQWADPSSLLTLGTLSRRLAYLPVCLIGCLRPSSRAAELDGLYVSRRTVQDASRARVRQAGHHLPCSARSRGSPAPGAATASAEVAAGATGRRDLPPAHQSAAVPIMPSLDTRAASASSSSPPAPAGRAGTTR